MLSPSLEGPASMSSKHSPLKQISQVKEVSLSHTRQQAHDLPQAQSNPHTTHQMPTKSSTNALRIPQTKSIYSKLAAHGQWRRLIKEKESP